MMNLGVAIYPPKNIQDIANPFRKRYDPNYALIAPHITLKEEFEAEEKELSTISDQLNSIAAEFNPFTVHIHKVSTFHPTNNVIYFAVKENEPLNELHRRIYNVVKLSPDQKYLYVPHLTIGQQLSDDELHDVYGRLKMKKYDYTFEVKRFHLLYRLENRTWTTQETFKLG